jgi:hypothetical protein
VEEVEEAEEEEEEGCKVHAWGWSMASGLVLGPK